MSGKHLDRPIEHHYYLGITTLVPIQSLSTPIPKYLFQLLQQPYCKMLSVVFAGKKKSLKLCLYLVLCVTYLFHWKQNMGKNVNKNTKQKKTVSEPLDEQKMDKMPSAITFMYHSSGLEMEVRLLRRLEAFLSCIDRCALESIYKYSC